MPKVGGSFTLDLEQCARCGEDHKTLTFAALTTPMRVDLGQRDWEEFTHWAMCPTLNEPIMAKGWGVTAK